MGASTTASIQQSLLSFFGQTFSAATSTLASLGQYTPTWITLGVPVVIIVGLAFWFFGLLPFTSRRRRVM